MKISATAALPVIGLAALLAVSAAPVVDHNWGTIPSQAPTRQAHDGMKVGLASQGCSTPENWTKGQVPVSVVVASDGEVLRVPFADGWVLATEQGWDTLALCPTA